MDFINKKIFSKKILFIDGIGRTGKTMVSRVLPFLEKCEQIEFFESLESILIGVDKKHVSIKFAKSYITNEINLHYYNKKISRRINFRPLDASTSKNFKNNVYEKREKIEERVGKKLFLKQDWIQPFFTHDLALNLNHLKKIISKFKLLEIYRDPFDVVYSWYKRGWGKRLQDQSEPIDFSLKFKFKNYTLPFYVHGYEKKWINLNEIEKCASIVKTNIVKSIKNQKKYNSNNILTISYENFLIEPLSVLNHVCKFLKTKKSKYIYKSLKKNNLPGQINYKNQNKKKIFILDQVSKKTGEELISLQKQYYKNIYGLKKY